MGEVVESRCDGVAVGERLFGFLPMGSYLVLRPGAVSASGFFDHAMPRADAAPILHYFLRWNGRPQPATVGDGLFVLFYPLFGVGYLLADYVAASRPDTGSLLLITAASSKTATCAAFCLRRENVTLVDVAGDARLRDAIHQHYGERLCASISVGRTHWAAFKPPRSDMPGPRPKQFWAPHYGRVRISSAATGLSREQYNAGLTRAWRDFANAVLNRPQQPPFEALTLSGPGGIAVAWTALLDGSADPHEGFVVQL